MMQKILIFLLLKVLQLFINIYKSHKKLKMKIKINYKIIMIMKIKDFWILQRNLLNLYYKINHKFININKFQKII
jgi:hypothetical protein